MAANTKLFEAMGIFIDAMRPFIVAVIQRWNPDKDWEDIFYPTLTLDQQRVWDAQERNLSENGSDRMNRVDFNTLFSFSIASKECLKDEVGSMKGVNDLISCFRSIRDIRNKNQHYQGLDQDDIDRAYLEMKSAAKLLEMTDLYEKIQQIQRSEDTPVPPVQQATVAAPVSVSAAGGEEGLPSWFNNAIPHFDIQNSKLDESVFAANLAEVALGTGPDIYTNPTLFFAKTYVTDGLKDISKRVIAALNGEESENRVISLQTGFGGGKTHTLISLYHIVRSGKNLSAILGDSSILSSGVNPVFDDAKVAVFTNNTTDASQGRVTEDGFPIFTLWGELAYQLGGKAGYEKVRQNDIDRIAPSSLIFKPILEQNAPLLILIDELADYCVRAKGIRVGQGTLFNQTNSFIQTLTEVVASVPKTVLIVTLPASATEVASQADGQEVLSALETRVVRVGSTVKPVDDEEVFEVVRRRLFDRIIDEDIIKRVAKQYKSMYHNRYTDLPAHCDNVSYENRMRKSYPFHPELIDMFRLRWGNDPRFQRTRGVLRLLASIVQDLWRRRYSLSGTQALIQTSDVNLENLPTLTGTITNLMGSNWETVMHADVVGSSSNAYLIDNADPSGALATNRLTQGVATTLLLASIGGDHQHGLSMKELKLCVLKPASFSHNDVNGCLSKLEEVAHYLYSSTTGERRFWFQSKANINILINQAKADVTKDEQNAEILRKLSTVNSFMQGGMKILINPSLDIPEQRALAMIIMHPQYAVPVDRIDANTERFVKQTATKRGGIDRVYRNTIFYLVCTEAGRASLNAKLSDLIACNKILNDFATTLERDQKQEIENRRRTYEQEVGEALVQAYGVVLKYSVKNGISRYNVKNFARDLSGQISVNILPELRDEEMLLDSIGRRTLDDNNLLPTLGTPVQIKAIYEAFLKFDDKPMISGPDAVEKTVRRYCAAGAFNVASGTPGNWTRIFHEVEYIPFLDVNSEDFYIVDPSIVETTPDEPQPGIPSDVQDPEPTPPGPGEGGEGGDPIPPVRKFKSITIKGQVDLANWSQIFTSFIAPLRSNNPQMKVEIKAKSTILSELAENSPLYQTIKESANQLGLEIDVEE